VPARGESFVRVCQQLTGTIKRSLRSTQFESAERLRRYPAWTANREARVGACRDILRFSGGAEKRTYSIAHGASVARGEARGRKISENQRNALRRGNSRRVDTRSSIGVHLKLSREIQHDYALYKAVARRSFTKRHVRVNRTLPARTSIA